MWKNANWTQRIGLSFSIVILAMCVVVSGNVVLDFLTEGRVQIDGIAHWLVGIMIGLILDRHLVQPTKSALRRVPLTLIVVGTVACVGVALQTYNVEFVGFSTKGQFVIVALLVILAVFLTDKLAEGRKR